MNLIPGDVGRPVTDLASALLYPNLVADAEAVLATLALVEKQIPTKTGNWFSVRIMPYRTMDNVIDGLVITFLDITVHRRPAAGLGGEPKPTRPTELKP